FVRNCVQPEAIEVAGRINGDIAVETGGLQIPLGAAQFRDRRVAGNVDQYVAVARVGGDGGVVGAGDERARADVDGQIAAGGSRRQALVEGALEGVGAEGDVGVTRAGRGDPHARAAGDRIGNVAAD